MAVPNNIVIPSVSNLSGWGKCSESEVVEREMRIFGGVAGIKSSLFAQNEFFLI
jgi:hypothetical protein